MSVQSELNMTRLILYVDTIERRVADLEKVVIDLKADRSRQERAITRLKAVYGGQ